jgi:hypothetical protein
MNKINYKILFLVIFSLNIFIKGQDNEENLDTPGSGMGDPFSHKCWRPKIKDYTLSAQCKDNSGNILNSSVSFLKCLKNYEGDLTSFDGRTGELPIKKCQLNGFTLNCQCEQTDGGLRWCYIHLDSIFHVYNGELRC